MGLFTGAQARALIVACRQAVALAGSSVARMCGLLAAVLLMPFVTAVESHAGADASVRVAVTSKPVHSLVAQVMEGVAAPLLIVEGSSSAHTFTLKPSGARAIAESGLFIRVSEGMEPFTRKLVEGLPRDVTVLTLADAHLGVTLLTQRTSGTFESHSHGEEEDGHSGHDAHDDDHDHESGHKHDHAHGHDEQHVKTSVSDPAGVAMDGHVWLDPENARAIVAGVAKTLSAKWPQHAAAFTANAGKADAALENLEREIAAGLDTVKGKPFIVFHDAYQYFEHRFGIAAAGAVTLSPDHPPSAKRLTEVRQKLRTLQAACIFAEPNFQPKLLAAVAEGAPVRTGTLDPEGQSLEPGPELYGQLMRALARDLKSCLASS